MSKSDLLFYAILFSLFVLIMIWLSISEEVVAVRLNDLEMRLENADMLFGNPLFLKIATVFLGALGVLTIALGVFGRYMSSWRRASLVMLSLFFFAWAFIPETNNEAISLYLLCFGFPAFLYIWVNLGEAGLRIWSRLQQRKTN